MRYLSQCAFFAVTLALVGSNPLNAEEKNITVNQQPGGNGPHGGPPQQGHGTGTTHGSPHMSPHGSPQIAHPQGVPHNLNVGHHQGNFPAGQMAHPNQQGHPNQVHPNINQGNIQNHPIRPPATARTPSMSRIDTGQHHAVHGQVNAPRPIIGRPNQEQVRQFLHGQPVPNRDATHGQFKQYFQQSRQNPVNRDELNQRQHTFTSSYGKNWKKNHQVAANVRSQIKSIHPSYNRWFTKSFFDNHQVYPYYYRSGYNWWKPTTWVIINNYLDWGWGAPVYYDSGYSFFLPPDYENYQQNYVNSYNNEYPELVPIPPPSSPMISSQNPGSEDENELATNQNAAQEWLPLGVYAVGRSAEDAAYSNLFIQLAIDRNGDIAGTYYNSSTEDAEQLNGTVDKDTQQVVWKVSDNVNSPIWVTGLYNLTQDMGNVDVKFPDGTVQQWVLVRLN